MTLSKSTLAFLLFSSACDTGVGTWSGHVAGQSMLLQSAIFVQRTADVQLLGSNEVFPDQPLVDVWLSDSKTLCDDVQTSGLSSEHTYVALSIIEVSFDGNGFTAPNVGIYDSLDPNNPTENGNNAGTLQGVFFSQQCGAMVTDDQWDALGGSIFVHGISSQAGGSLSADITNLTFGSQSDVITGNFNATYCAGLANFTSVVDPPDQIRQAKCQ